MVPYQFQSTRFHICRWTPSVKPNHMPPIAANYPGSGLSALKNLSEFEASLILQPLCFAMRWPSTRWGLVCYRGCRRCNQASIITLPEAECAWGPRQQALMWGAAGRRPADTRGRQMEAAIKHGQTQNTNTERKTVVDAQTYCWCWVITWSCVILDSWFMANSLKILIHTKTF